VLAVATPAQAIVIGFDPSSQTVAPGASVDVELTVSGLGDFAPDSLSVFDLDVSFDPAVLSFSAVAFGDPVLGDQLDLFGFGSFTDVVSGVGVVNLLELSFDLPGDLDTLQAGSFTLATLTFDALAVGTSALSVAINALGDSFGDPLDATLAGGSVTVNAAVAMPEPGTLWLLAIGLLGLGLLRRRA
jgi:hypothetical protein